MPSVDHGWPAVRAVVRQDTPSKLPAQLSIWIFITHESDIYKKVVFGGQKSPPGLGFAMRSIPGASQAKTCEKSPFSHVLARDGMGIHRIANPRTGGDFSHRNRTFLYTSLSCAINIQILNCDSSPPVFAGEKSPKNPATFAGN